MEKEKKRKPAGPYVRLNERADKGDLELVAPLDYLLMEMCPPEGTLVLGVYPHATTVREMCSKMPKELPRTLITSRIRSLHIQGLLESVKSPKTGHGTGSRAGNSMTTGWQITPRGQEALNKWKESQANGST